MRDTVVYCGGIRPGKRRSNKKILELDTAKANPRTKKINLNIGDITRPMVEHLPDRLADLLEVACYVYCADQFSARDSLNMPEMGAAWHRRFEFHIPVRDLRTWQRAEVQEALVSLLSMLSEDHYDFSFVQGETSSGLQPYLDLAEERQANSFVPDRVALFSGGLDSFAGAAEALLRQQEKIALVSHQAAPLVQSRQAQLIDALRQRSTRGQLFHIGVSVNKGSDEAAEYTQRSRSFLFAALGFVVARLFGKQAITFFENGVVSMNLPVAEHVLGARATRTTHPAVLAGMQRLFSLLADETFNVTNPYMWMTKADVVDRIEELGCGDLIARTFSCAHPREATIARKHCGKCSQCIDRRFGILAAGLGKREGSDNYVIDLLQGARSPGPDLVLAESFVLSATKFAKMTPTELASRYGQIYRALRHLEGSVDENLMRLHHLHVRHGKAVTGVIDRAQGELGMTGFLALPETSLLSLIHAQTPRQPFLSSAETGSLGSRVVPTVMRIIEQPLSFAIDRGRRKVVFSGGIELTGQSFKLFEILFDQFKLDQDANTPPADYGYLASQSYAARAGLTEPSLRQGLKRFRSSIEDQFNEVFGSAPQPDAIIESKSWKGYRLNPFLVAVPLAVLASKTRMANRDYHDTETAMSQLGSQEAAE